MALPPPGTDSAAIVTGASSGIGEEFAKIFAARGYQVILVARSADKLEDLAARLGSQAHPLPADLSHRSDRAGLLDRVAALGLSPDILVNNAGLSTLGLVAESVPEKELNLVEVDVAAVVDLCSRFLPGMVERHRGAILNVASVAAFGPLPGQAAYGAAKAFVLSYTHSLRGELKGTGVTVTALCPGPVDTGFGEAAGFTKEEADSALPRVMWVPAEQVAKGGVDGLAAGKAVVIPGRVNRVAAGIFRVAPPELMLPFLARNHPALKRK
ncbi:SDR family NAD(P)-dependent oxidoreductase [Mycobacterium bourgelatii]|uniref:Ketoacyl reductase n=1 Tax=Mycobacterium bourgelatii TaxID=1273442 RepID=A0A7I9YZ92_MYCBU|nr:SDR family oxidoreductase [Mycobacterium bourgelatii]MCV6976486.1 SDR family oxidoreductase [Mycobacterium bourgelatii]GFG93933.1 ketoacyl reductase [Mycobacterium bourgelatii]